MRLGADAQPRIGNLAIGPHPPQQRLQVDVLDGFQQTQPGTLAKRIEPFGEAFRLVNACHPERYFFSTLIERLSRAAQRPASTCARKSPSVWLNSAGSSIFTVWPLLGKIARPAVAIIRLR